MAAEERDLVKALERLEVVEKAIHGGNWKLDKRINISTIFSVFAASVVILIYAKDIESRVTVNTVNIGHVVSAITQVAVTLDKIDDKLDGKADRRYPADAQ